MKIGDYVRFYDRDWTEIGQIVDEVEDSHLKVVKCKDDYYDLDNFIKSSPDILDLLKPMDLLYIDIDNDYADGIIVPRIAETQNELNLMIGLIKSGKWILKGVVTSEQLDSMKYKVGD